MDKWNSWNTWRLGFFTSLVLLISFVGYIVWKYDVNFEEYV